MISKGDDEFEVYRPKVIKSFKIWNSEENISLEIFLCEWAIPFNEFCLAIISL